MGARLLCLCLLAALLGYYIYSPLPEDLAQPWTVMLTSAALRALAHLVRWRGLGGQGRAVLVPLVRVCHAAVSHGHGVTPTQGQGLLK